MKYRVFFILLAFLFFSSLAWARVNINSADATTLQQLKGIGPAKAQAIVKYREKHGPFAKVEDLTKVKGIGPATLERLRDHIEISSPAQASPGKAKYSAK